MPETKFILVEVPEDCFYIGYQGTKCIDLPSTQMARVLCDGKEVIKITDSYGLEYYHVKKDEVKEGRKE